MTLIALDGDLTAQEIDRNPYHLELVTSADEYLDQVKSDSNLELLNIEIEIPDVVLDIKYATPTNFTGEVIYDGAKAFARAPVVRALREVQDSLARLGLGLKIYDAYRPYAATLRFYEVYRDTNFVANPRRGSRHNRGCAVDVNLIDLRTGDELAMPSGFDEFTELAHPRFMDLPVDVISNRELLISIMEFFGFSVYPTEWWHFDFNGWENYPLMDLEFSELEGL